MAGKDVISVTFYNKDGSLRVSMGLLEKFGLPKYMRFLINTSEKVFGVEPCNRSDPTGIKITYTMSGLTSGYRAWSCLLVEKIYELMGWDISKKYRVYGTYSEEKKMGLFDLNKYGFVEELKYYDKGGSSHAKKKKKKTCH